MELLEIFLGSAIVMFLNNLIKYNTKDKLDFLRKRMEELNSKYKEARGEEKERVEEELNGVMGELMRESLKNMAFSIVIFAPVLMYFNWQFKSPLTVSIFNKVFTLNWIWYYVFFSLVLSLLFSGFFSLYKRRKEMKEGDPK